MFGAHTNSATTNVNVVVARRIALFCPKTPRKREGADARLLHVCVCL